MKKPFNKFMHFLPMIIFFSLPALIALRYNALALTIIYVIMAALVCASLYKEDN